MNKKVLDQAVQKNSFSSKTVRMGHLNAADPSYPRWRFHKIDKDGEHDLFSHPQQTIKRIMGILISYEQMNWSNIQQSTRGGKKAASRCHYINPEVHFTKEGEKLFRGRHLEEYVDNIFSIEITGAERVLGILQDGVFDVLWYDQEHKIVSHGA